MDDKPLILQLPVEVLQRIARYVDHQPIVRFQVGTDLTALLHFRLTCTALEKASFDVLVDRFPRRLRCYIHVLRNLQSLKAQSSQNRLISRLKQVTLAVDILAGSYPGDIKTVRTVRQSLDDAQLFDYQVHETDFYERKVPSGSTDLVFALQRLRALPISPAIKIFVWLSEDIYLKHQESKNVVPMLSNAMDAIPPQMLSSLQLAYVHCDPQNILQLLERSSGTLEEFTMDNVSSISSEPRWTEVLAELTKCTKLKHLMLCNLREECLGAVLHTRQRSPFSPFHGYFYAGFSGLERVTEGLQSLIRADLCADESDHSYEEERF